VYYARVLQILDPSHRKASNGAIVSDRNLIVEEMLMANLRLKLVTRRNTVMQVLLKGSLAKLCRESCIVVMLMEFLEGRSSLRGLGKGSRPRRVN
jgi:hypothetical protein